MSSTIPPRIRHGDAIGICLPAGPIKISQREQFQRGLDRLSMFELRLGRTLSEPRDESAPSYLSAHDQQRADELMGMIRDPSIRAIVMGRGGYGIMRILELLDPSDLRRDPKPIVGFSDGTALLSWAHHAGVRGIHGPVITQLATLPQHDVDRLVRVLTDPSPLGEQDWTLERAGLEAMSGGPLIPANLTMAAMLVGTPWALPLEGVALFEEVGEKPYELDRYLMQLELTRALHGVGAVVLGELIRCTDPNPPTGVPDAEFAARDTIIELLARFETPCAYGAPVGHGARNAAVPFGASCDLVLGTTSSLTINEGAVS